MNESLETQLCRYIDMPSVSGDEAAFAELLERELTGRGYQVQRQQVVDNRWNVVALPRGRARLLFSTHIDVVPPHIGSRREGDRIYGRGACDTKGGLVAMMAAAERLDPDRESIGFLLVVGEEVDHCGAVAARALDLQVEAIILCEPTRRRVIIGQKGILKIGLTSHGVAAHSAFPELGEDALAPMLDALERLRRAEYPTSDELGPTTLNIGKLSAGVAANVTPAKARAELMYRASVDPVVLAEQVRALAGDRLEVEVLSQNPPTALTAVPGFPTDIIAFNTDAYYLQGHAPVVLFGPGDIRVAHGVDEHIEVAELYAGVEDYVRLAQALLQGGVSG